MDTSSFLIVGGCGHQGAQIVKLLLERYPKAKVSVMSRNPNANNFPGVQYLKGDVTSTEEIRHALEASKPTVLVHTASLIGVYRKVQVDLLRTVNVEGTRKLLEESKRYGVKAFVYTSTATVVYKDAAFPMVNATESQPMVTYDDPVDDYNKTKSHADRLVCDFDDKNGMRTCSIRVGALYGEYDTEQIPGFINQVRDGRARIQLGGGQNLFSAVYSGNTAYAHLLAAEKLLAGDDAVAGEGFNIADEHPPKFWEHARAIYRAAGVDVKPNQIIRIPVLVALFFAILDEVWAWLRGTEPTTTRGAVRYATRDWTINSQKAIDRLGYRPIVGYEEGVKKGVEWYIEKYPL
ncbi:hypothetical protein BX600DRAFT_514132 [Xylariales sp. PMI_506]|nr:hypothetical protein BX600DRAFT_514132 [Xylariales sp. PMI_506]